MRSLSAALLLLFAIAANAAEPVAPAPLAETSFPTGFASVSTSNGRFLAQWRLDTSVDQRIDGMAVDENGRRTTDSARTLLPPPIAQPVGLIPAGDHYTLAYFDPRFMLRFARIGADGMLDGDAGIDAYPNAPRTRWTEDGSRIFIVQYLDGVAYGTLLDGSGRVIRSGIYLGAPGAPFVDVVTVGDAFALLSSTSDGLATQLIARDGTIGAAVVLDNPPDLARIGQVTAATDGERQFYLWVPYGGGAASGVVVANGSVIKRVSLGDRPGPTGFVQKILWTGKFYLAFVGIGSDQTRSVAVMRLDRDANVLDASPLPVTAVDPTARFDFADAAWNGTVAYAVMVQWRFAQSRIVGVAVRSDGTVVRTETLSVLPARQNAVAAASDGTDSLVVWRESEFGKQRLLASLLVDGVPGRPILLASVDGSMGEPVVSYGGGVYLAAFLGQGGVNAIRIDRTGVLLDASPFVAVADSDFLGRPAIVWDGAQFLVAAGGYNIVAGAFISTAGAVGPRRELGAGRNPALAWNGQRFLLASDMTRFAGGVWVPPDIYVASLSAEAVPLSDMKLLMTSAGKPVIASSGSEFLVVSGMWGFMGMWLDASASPRSDPFLILRGGSTDAYDASRPVAVQWTGSAYVIAAHNAVGSTSQLTTGSLAPLAVNLQAIHAEPSRPDRLGGSSVAIAAEIARPRIVFSDLQNGGSSRVMVEAIDAIPLQRGRGRAVGH